MDRKARIGLIFVCLLLIGLACNFPGVGAPTPFEFPTPNLTMTTIFGTLSVQNTLASMPTTTFEFVSSVTQEPVVTFIPSNTITNPHPTATKTIPATVSYEGPGARTGVSVTALYLKNEPTIDGVFDEWNLDRYQVDRVVYGKSLWESESDLSGNFMIGWDENNLFIATRVKDDKYKQNAHEEELFMGDSLEVLLDTSVSSDFYYKKLNNDDFQLGISPGSPQPGTNPEAYLWFPKSLEGKRGQVKIGSTPTDDGYRVEVKIPWDLFGVNPVKGMHMGFAFSISDNDKSGENLQQSMVSNITSRSLIDPTTWGDLTLKKP
jgi:hypothetical protein